jgi:hypothetical protein
MGCPALGVWVAFFKQPALPGEAPKKRPKPPMLDIPFSYVIRSYEARNPDL